MLKYFDSFKKKYKLKYFDIRLQISTKRLKNVCGV